VLGRVKNNPVVAHRVLGRSGDQSRQEEPRTVSLSLKGGRSRHPGCGKPINRSNRPEHHGCVETRVAGKSICEEYTMKTTVAPIPFAGSMFGSYRHECAFFSSPQEEYATLLPFVRDGLDTPSHHRRPATREPILRPAAGATASGPATRRRGTQGIPGMTPADTPFAARARRTAQSVHRTG